MSKQTHRTIHIPVMHQSLQRTLTRFLNDHSEAPEHCTDAAIILEEIDFCDFGVKYKLIQLQTDNGTRADFQVLIPGWQEIQTDAIERLRAIYGGSLYCRNDAKSKGNYDFVIRLNEAVDNFDSVDSCATSLAQIRVQAAGAPLFKALDRIVSNESESSKSMEKVYRLLAQPRCGTCHCISSAEKTMVIFTVDFQEEMERALTRLFLQQFAGAQKQVSQSPHCEFRRGNDPPKEILNLTDDYTQQDSSKPTCYVSFTFFPSYVKTVERRMKAVELMVNFFPYLDKHIKSTKSYMHSRMRTKKDDLLSELKELNTCKGPSKNRFNGKVERKFLVSG